MKSMDELIKTNKKWFEILEKFTVKKGVLFVVGGVDTGKSTFCRWICTELAARKIPTALVDSDLGQSDVGPPACVGMALYDKLPVLFSANRIDGLYFVGDTTPVRHQAACMAGISAMVRQADSMGASCVVVNTTGWIQGRGAEDYKLAKINMLKPAFIAAFEKENDLSHILNPYRNTAVVETIRVPLSDVVKSRSREERGVIRRKRFDEYFARNVLISVKLKSVGVSGLEFPVLKPEILGQVIGLSDENNNDIALGIVKDYDTIRRKFEISTPYMGDVLRIRKLQFASFFL
jgi:polynucleotide 5'-hydroxyl-kinase GRC3/NOL9